jgi:hypothetical protein
MTYHEAPGGGVVSLLYYFFNPDASCGLGGYSHIPAAVPSGKRPGTHCIGDWFGTRTGLDRCRKDVYIQLYNKGRTILSGRKLRFIPFANNERIVFDHIYISTINNNNIIVIILSLLLGLWSRSRKEFLDGVGVGRNF